MVGDTFEPREIGVDFVNNPDMKTVCRDLHDIWVELDLDKIAIEQEKHDVIKEVSALVQTKLAAIRTAKEQKLKKHRVLKIRAELEHWWAQCHFSEEQKHEFEPYLSQDFTDELLTLHQRELTRLQQYHADNLHLFGVIDQYMELYDRHLQLEAQDKNPNRLFDNRGGQLLKDERDRKAARKLLPSLGRKVDSLTAEFELKYGRPFTRDGVGFEESLKRHAQRFKENLLPPGSEVKNKGSAIKQRGSAVKRKHVTPPGVSKLPRMSVRKVLL